MRSPPKGENGTRGGALPETYLRLSARGKAEIRQISVNHNDYCLGIKITYNDSGSDCITHHSNPNCGYYNWHGGPQRESSLILADDEYLCEVRTRQGEITDQVTFCTNKRTVSFGGNGGAADPRDVCNTPVDLTKRVVAIVGTFTQGGALGKIGTVSVPHNWEVIGEFILLRELVERNRASPNALRTRGQVAKKEETVLQTLMNVDASIFRRVLSFLIANVETDQV